VRVTRRHHALQGKLLEVFAKLRHKGKPHFLLVLPDGSRSYIPVAWTDFVSSTENPDPNHPMVASAGDLLRLRQRVDCLLHRIHADPTTSQTSQTQENGYATATTGTVERGATSDSTGLSRAHPSAAKPDHSYVGPTHSEDGPGTSLQPSDANQNQPL
jgi:hypothetical protein